MSETTGQGPTLADARDHIAAYLKGLPLAAHAAAILDFVGERGMEPFGFGEAVEATGGADVGQVLATLSHLLQGRNPPLSMSVVFTDADGTEHVVDGPVNEILDGALYAHPVTGEAVANAGKHMYFRYEPVPGLLREQEASPAFRG